MAKERGKAKWNALERTVFSDLLLDCFGCIGSLTRLFADFDRAPLARTIFLGHVVV
jgi:hypothetical protein